MKEIQGFMSIGTLTNKYKVLNTFIILGTFAGAFWLFTHPIGGSLTSTKNILLFAGILLFGIISSMFIADKAYAHDEKMQKEMQKPASVDNAMKEVNLYVEKVQKGEIRCTKGETVLFGHYVTGKIRIRSGKTFLDVYIDDKKMSSRILS